MQRCHHYMRDGTLGSIGRLRALDVLLLNPGHEIAQTRSGLLNQVFFARLKEFFVFR